MPKIKHHSILWSGSDSSFEMYCNAYKKYALMSPMEAGVVLGNDDDPVSDAEAPKSRLLQVEDGVALINIAGVLTNSNDWWVKWAGMVSYDEIRQAAHEAAESGATQALVYLDTPGGSVSGVMDAAASLYQLGKVMPVEGFSDSQATSAGYWLMAAAKSRTISPVAMVGSIGVIAKHFSYAGAYEEAGIKPTVVRAGEFKALSVPEEDLSPKALKVLQGHAEYLYSVFVGDIAHMLNMSYQQVESKMAKGREFIGQQAVEAGLVDSLGSFDEVYMKLINKANKAGGNNMPGKKFSNLSAAMAAVSAGVDPAVETEETVVAPEASIEDAPTPEAAAAEDTSVEASAEETPAVETEETVVAPEASAEETPAAEAAEEDTSVVAMLQTQLKASQEVEVGLKVDIKTLQGKYDDLVASIEPMKGIVAGSLNTMLIALGGSREEGLEKLGVDALVTRYDATATTFKANFKVGGVGVVDASREEETQGKAQTTPVEKARVAAVK